MNNKLTITNLMFVGDFMIDKGYKEQYTIPELLNKSFYKQFPKKAFQYANTAGTFIISYNNQQFELYEDLSVLYGSIARIIKNKPKVDKSYKFTLDLEINFGKQELEFIVVDNELTLKLFDVDIYYDDEHEYHKDSSIVSQIIIPYDLFVEQLSISAGELIAYQIIIYKYLGQDNLAKSYMNYLNKFNQ